MSRPQTPVMMYWQLTDTEISVIGISNDLFFRDKLDPRMQSSLCERELQFSTYDAGELQAIFRDRTDTAFKPDALEDGVIPYFAAFVASELGDVRKALDLLYEAGQIVARMRPS